jgi:hypothetical protein
MRIHDLNIGEKVNEIRLKIAHQLCSWKERPLNANQPSKQAILQIHSNDGCLFIQHVLLWVTKSPKTSTNTQAMSLRKQ